MPFFGLAFESYASPPTIDFAAAGFHSEPELPGSNGSSRRAEMSPAADRGNHHCMAMTIKQLRAASDDDLIEAHDEVASYHRLGRLPDEDRGDGGGAIAVTGISRELSVIVLGTALSRWLKSGAAQLGLEPPL